MMDSRNDRLYQLLPQIYRLRDTEQGEPLKGLLQVISEQVNLIEDDIRQLYENWFIETCEDWVVPYIGELVGYSQVHEAGELTPGESEQQRLKNRILIPRREVANSIRNRRRKGTLALLELLAKDVAGWPARAVEFYKLLGWSQHLNHQRLQRGRLVNLKDNSGLNRVNTSFEQVARSVDLRRINSLHQQGMYNIPSIGLYIWRLIPFKVSKSPAYCLESAGPHCFTFSVLGNNCPLYVNPQAEPDPSQIADELHLPVTISRHLFAEKKNQLYGAPGSNGSGEKSLRIYKGIKRGKKIIAEPIASDRIIPANLSDWQYRVPRGKVAVDPELGRIAFPSKQLPKSGVWVDYHYGFPANLGGGEYKRELSQAEEAKVFRVGSKEEFTTIQEAIQSWSSSTEDTTTTVKDAVIELAESEVFVEPINIEFGEGQRSLQLRAANGKRPVIRLLDWLTSQPDSLTVTGHDNNHFSLDGLLISGRGIQIGGDMSQVDIRHSTLVPGWHLDCDGVPQRPNEPSLEIFSPDICVKIEFSILGPIQVDPALQSIEQDPGQDRQEQQKEDEIQLARCRGIGGEVRLDPIKICLSDSILDGTGPEHEAIGSPGCPVAHANLTVKRSTIFGQIHTHAILLGENSIFEGKITVARRQQGCIRFSYLNPESRTPRRYRCQPELAEQKVSSQLKEQAVSQGISIDIDALETAREQERLRVKPRFSSRRYGSPAYCQLLPDCPIEISRGADDEAEMGVYHHLYQPQRTANLRVRLNEYIPAAMDVGIIFSS